MQLFEDAVARWQLNVSSNDAPNRIIPPEFVRVMFRVAAEFGSVSCHAMDKETLCFTVGEIEIRTVHFLPFHGIRVLLAAIAHVFWNQTPEEPISKRFNPYGDSAEIKLEINGQQMRFQVETANTGSETLSFAIRRTS